MDSPMSDLHFRTMSWVFRIRDLSIDFESIMRDSGVKRGYVILDYGCGPGSYTFAASRAVGDNGKVIAADIQPLAIRRVSKFAKDKKLGNIKTVRTDRNTGMEDNSVDVVLFFDIYHSLGDPESVLYEMRRVLKPDGILAFTDHHYTDEEIPSMISETGIFRFEKKAGKIFRFRSRMPAE